MLHERPNLRGLIQKTTVLPRIIRDCPTQMLLEVSSAADLRRLARKTAAAEVIRIPEADFEIKPKHTYILLITLGGGETYGFNDNADYYPEYSGMKVEFPEPMQGGPSSMVLGKGLQDCHSTFAKYGAVYRNHHTEPVDRVPRSGEVVFERWRPDMHWGELIAELPHNKWQKELDLFERGIPLTWSQGSGVPKDVCRRCGFVYDKNSPARCEHTSDYRLCVPEDGIANVILCNDATFYDISYVGSNPAAKIAWGLMKVASCDTDPDDSGSWQRVIPIFDRLKERARITSVYPLESAMRSLLAAERSVLPGEPEAFRNTCSVDPQLDLDFVDTCRGMDPEKLLGVLQRLGIILTPTQWWRIFNPDGGEPSSVSGFTGALRDVFSRAGAETDGGFSEEAAWLPQGCPDMTDLRRLQPFAPLLSSRPVPKLVIIVKRARSEPVIRSSVADRFLAREYARYQTASVAASGKPYTSRWCTLANAAAI